MMKRYCWRKADVNPLWYLQRESGACARLNTRRADLPVQYQLNLCSRESLCRSVICALPPVSELDTTASMYCAGLGLELLGSFTDHEGFSGIMLGAPEAGWHLEFTHCRHHPVTPRPGDEDLLVLYYPQQAAWEAQCAAMDAAGFLRVTAFNPYWEVNGVTFVDRDGYRTVLQNRAWGMVCDSSGIAAS